MLNWARFPSYLKEHGFSMNKVPQKVLFSAKTSRFQRFCPKFLALRAHSYSHPTGHSSRLDFESVRAKLND